MFYAQEPAACQWYFTPLGLLIDLIVKALSQALPQKAAGAHYGDSMVIYLAGLDPRKGNIPFLSVEANPGGWGAFATGDGQDGLINNVNGGFKDMPVEVFESKYPVQIHHYRFRPDSGGPGKFRGGCGLDRAYHLEADCGLYLWFERSKTPAWGLFGGRDATGPENIIDGKSSGKLLKPLKANNIALKAGDIVTINTGGGGGFGNPWERDIELVRRDVLDGYVTREGAERDYGVAFTADGLEVDLETTRPLRADLSSS